MVHSAQTVVSIVSIRPKGFTVTLACGHSFWSSQKALYERRKWCYCPTCPGQWSRHWAECIHCGTHAAKYQGEGFCSKCYWLVRTPPGDFTDYSKNRQFHVNDHFLDDWAEGSAYFVGVMYGDGCLPNLKGRATHRLEINIKASDRRWLEDIAALLHFQGPIREWTIRDQYMPRDVISLGFASKRLRSRLVAIGFREKTTACIPDKIFRHFARGLFDADGSIYKVNSSPGRWETSFTGQYELLQEVAYRLHLLVGTKYPKSLYEKSNSPGTFSLRFATAETVMLHAAFYDGSTVYLARKKQRFEQLLKWRSQHVRSSSSGDDIRRGHPSDSG